VDGTGWEKPKGIMTTIDLKISLKHIEPPIWRRIRISSEASLLDLHYVIQHAFGWTNNHLFIMQIKSMKFVNYQDWQEDAYQFQSAALAILEDFISREISIGEKISYVYDMGDGWEHEICIISIDDANQSFSGAICVDGKRACPPEDVGGLPGYYQLLDGLQNNTFEEYQQAMGWLGYSFDPEAFDLDNVNRSLSDYYKATQLKDDSYWAKLLPMYNPKFDFVSGWLSHLSAGHRKYAEALTFRRDVVALLIYLRDHKVRGTKAMGNFPRKDIRAMAARFENPMRLDLDFGDKVYELRTEDEVPEMIFMHNFVNTAGLILGGENTLWELTSLGEKFLASNPEQQAWFLVKVWFYQFNWEFPYPLWDAELSGDFLRFQKTLIEQLLTYPNGQRIKIYTVTQDLDKSMPGWIIVKKQGDYDQSTKRRFFTDVVVKPFEKFGLFEVVKTKDEDFNFDFYFNYTHIIMTDFGKTLMMYLR